MTFRSLFVLWSLSACVSPLDAEIVFQKERIDAVIRSFDTLEIRGTYRFINTGASAVSSAIFYPFPLDSNSSYPHYIQLTHCSKNRPVRFDTLAEGIRWTMTVPPKAADSFKVVYRQFVRSPKGRYIVTTTKYWKRPLQSAGFRVVVSPEITLDYWSFPLDSVHAQGGELVYYSHFSDFSPEEDMVFRWKRK